MQGCPPAHAFLSLSGLHGERSQEQGCRILADTFWGQSFGSLRPGSRQRPVSSQPAAILREILICRISWRKLSHALPKDPAC